MSALQPDTVTVRAGDGRVELRLLADASVCPDDCYPANGGDGSAKDFSVLLRGRGS